MWILIVSADAGLRDGTRRLLVAMGHRVVGARGCAEATAHLHLRRFDLVAADPDVARLPWASALADRWDTFDVPLAVIREPGDLLEPLRMKSRGGQENSARAWPCSRETRLASRLLTVRRATRRGSERSHGT